MAYCIRLGDGVRLSSKQYLAAYRAAESSPDDTFKQSFRDPRGWMGRTYSGAQIVAQHWEMIAERWASLECKWCGQKTGGNDFCDASCRVSYSY